MRKIVSVIVLIVSVCLISSCINATPSIKFYTVTFKDYDGSILKNEIVEEGYKATSPQDPIRYGYNFIGWDNDYTNIKKDLYIYATYETIKYNIKYEVNEGTMSKDTPSIYTIEDNIILNNPFKEGYTFDGWYDNPEFNGNKIEKIQKGTTGDIELYAKYNPINYNITYTLNDGINNELNPNEYSIEQEIVLKTPTKEGYTFIGWEYNGGIIGIIPQGTIGNIELVAKWEISKFTITFDADGGNAIEYVEGLYNNIIDEPAYPAKSGYGFIGWYYDEEEWNFEKNVVTADITLTAKWIDSSNFSYVIEKNAAAITDYNGSIQEIIIPKNLNGYVVTNISEYAFLEKDITSVKIASTVTVIGEGAFADCYNLEKVYIPKSVINIENYAFSGCENLKNIIIDSKNTVYDSRNNCNAIIETSTNTLIYGCLDLEIPSTVTNIGETAYSFCNNFTDIVIPYGITNIFKSAFEYCKNLETIVIPISVTNVGAATFYSCPKLEAVYYIGTEIEWKKIIIETENSNFTSVVFFYSEFEPTEPGNYWHYDSENNIEVWCTQKTFNVTFDSGHGSYVSPQTVLPNGLVQEPLDPISQTYGFIGWYYNDKEWDFMNDEVVENITLVARWIDNIYYSYQIVNNEAKIIWSYNFQDEVIIPRSIKGAPVTTICNSAFSQKSMKNIVLPNTLTTIEDFAFTSCYNLERLYIPSSVTSIGAYAFTDLSSITSVVVDPNNQVYDSHDNCNAIIETTTNTLVFGFNITEIPSSVTSIGNNAFIYCEELYNLIIPYGITSIGTSAFEDCCNLNSIIIPNSVTNIDENAFSGCYQLTIYYEGDFIPSGWISNFKPNNCHVYFKSEWEYDFNGFPTVIDNTI